jgi:hypothetical protein
MNRDDVHAKQSLVQRKMLNPNSFRHPDSGRIWTMVEYWTFQPLALRRRQLLANQHRTNHADVHSDGAAPAMPLGARSAKSCMAQVAAEALW